MSLNLYGHSAFKICLLMVQVMSDQSSCTFFCLSLTHAYLVCLYLCANYNNCTLCLLFNLYSLQFSVLVSKLNGVKQMNGLLSRMLQNV